MIYIITYRPKSKGAASLAKVLKGKKLHHDDATVVPMGPPVINWGNSSPIAAKSSIILNPPEKVKAASNKLRFFQTLRDAGFSHMPPFYIPGDEIPDKAFPIVCRTILTGHSGKGIVIANERSELVKAKLYVKYIKKAKEYRIHIGRLDEEQSIIAVQRKARKLDVPDEEVDWKVRSHKNGFVYTREDFDLPDVALDAAAEGFSHLGLDFGAVDVIWNENAGRAYLLEVNTAPGLEGQTVNDYAAFFRERLGIKNA